MTKIKNLNETILEVKKNKAIVNDLFAWQGKITEAYAYLAFYEDGKKKRFIEGDWSDDPKDLEKWLGLKEDLEAFLKKHKSKNFTNILFFLDMRHSCKVLNLEISDVLKRKFEIKSEIIDGILKDSKGFLLWRYQLENILRLFYVTRDDIQGFIKSLIRKEEKCLRECKKLKLSEGVSLKDILDDRLLLSDRMAVIPPRILFARNLYNLVLDGESPRAGY
jgi:hypothetical protein